MRTTLDIDEDLLFTIKDLARARGVSARRVISDLARKALTESASFDVENGVPLFPLRPDGQIVTLELVNKLRDAEW